MMIDMSEIYSRYLKMQDLDDSREGDGRAKQEARAECVCFYSERGATTRMAALCKEEQRCSG